MKNKFQNWEIIFMERMKQKTFSDQSSYSTQKFEVYKLYFMAEVFHVKD